MLDDKGRESGMLQRRFHAIGLTVLVVACLVWTREYMVPVAVAVLIWFLINALAGAIRRLPRVGARIPYRWATVVSVLMFFALIGFSVTVIAENVAGLGGVSDGRDVLLGKVEAIAAWTGLRIDLTPAEVYERLQLDTVIARALSIAQGLVADMSLVFLYVLFLLIDQQFFDAKMRALFTDDERRAEIEKTLSRIGQQTRAYLWLMTLISLGVAVMTYAACSFVGLEGAGFWGFLAFALNFIPTLGSITAVVLPAVYGLLTLDDPVALAVLIAALAGTQFVAGEVVLPRVMGDRLNLSSVVILLVLVGWGAIWGPVGMFLAIPVTVILTMIFARFPSTRPIAVLLSRDGRVPG